MGERADDGMSPSTSQYRRILGRRESTVQAKDVIREEAGCLALTAVLDSKRSTSLLNMVGERSCRGLAAVH